MSRFDPDFQDSWRELWHDLWPSLLLFAVVAGVVLAFAKECAG